MRCADGAQCECRRRQPLDPLTPLGVRSPLPRLRRRRCSAHVEFEDAPDHDKILRAIAVLGTHEAKRLVAIDEKAAADATGILNNPVSVIVSPDPEP